MYKKSVLHVQSCCQVVCLSQILFTHTTGISARYISDTYSYYFGQLFVSARKLSYPLKYEDRVPGTRTGGPGGRGGYFLIRGQWGCAPGWGRIFTTGWTITGLHFQESKQNRVAHFRIFGARKFFTLTVSKSNSMFLMYVKSKVFSQFKKMGRSPIGS